MGRWASFSTGFSYKFAVAVQSSEDICTFGGRNNLVYISESILEDTEELNNPELQKWVEENAGEDVPIASVPEELLDLVENEKSCYWTKEDLNFIKQELMKMSPNFIPDWSIYSLNEEGTSKLWDDLFEKFKEKEGYDRFILGCLIYHQLLYDEELSVSYE